MIETIVNDTTIEANLIKAGVMTLLYPLRRHDRDYKVLRRLNTPNFNLNYNLTKRVVRLEARQTLLEADLALLRGQLQYENINA